MSKASRLRAAVSRIFQKRLLRLSGCLWSRGIDDGAILVSSLRYRNILPPHAVTTTVVLETGKGQPEAIGLYQYMGCQVIDNYPPYEEMANSVCMEKISPHSGMIEDNARECFGRICATDDDGKVIGLTRRRRRA